MVALAFAARALTPATSQAIQADRLTTMAEAASAASELTYKLQRERTAAASLMASEGSASTLKNRAQDTDASLARYQEKRGELSSLPDSIKASVDRVDRSVDELDPLRAQARSGSSALSSMAFGYRIIVADLISYRDSIAQADGVDADVADHIRATAALSEAGENLAQQQVTVLRAISDGGFTPASQRSFDATQLGYTEATSTVTTLGPSEWGTWLESTLAGPKALAAERLEDEAGRTGANQQLKMTSGKWIKATSERLELLHSVEKRTDEAVYNTVDSQRSSLFWFAIGEMAVVVLTLVGVVLVALRLGRAMIRRLRALRGAAHDVAHVQLPQTVKTLSEPGAVKDATPEELAERAEKPMRDLRDDEIGEVGQAFNSMHYAAVRLAAQQAESHGRFAETLVGVARRGAQLNSVMTSELNRVQRDELDPERMEMLFALDHLAIRMERNAKNILVMGGYGQGRVRPSDAPCTSVIYAAAQQIEQYERVSLGHIEPTVAVAARVVDDVAHLLAELLDNATRFSPPEKKVGVAAWHLWDRAVIQIVDEGVGIAPERRGEINKELAEPQADVGAVRSMGLQVVARLAARHDVLVELRDSSGPGTIVEVTLPREALGTVSKAIPQSSEPSQTAQSPEFSKTPETSETVQTSRIPRASGSSTASAASVASTASAFSAASDALSSPGQRGRKDERDPDGREAGRKKRDSQPESDQPNGSGAQAQPEAGESGHGRTPEETEPGFPDGPSPGLEHDGHERYASARADEPVHGGDGPSRNGAPSTAAAGSSQQFAPGAPQPTPESRVSGYSASGLPMRKRTGQGGSHTGGASAEEQPRPAPAPRAKKSPGRRDSRQVSDVLAAYAQGINRSTSKRGSSSGGSTGSPGAAGNTGSKSSADDDT